VPTVLDADALNLLASSPSVLRKRGSDAPVLLTPHPGEMARLLGSSVPEVQGDRVRAAREAAERYGALVALKGARTVIATPGGDAFINPTGNPGMGSGGTGDVLTGMLGGLLAQGLDPLEALQLGVYLHGEAGDRAAARTGPHALLAGDLLDSLAPLLSDWNAARELVSVQP
jgi:NAD(P)H-hydrate epimerase